MRGMKKEQEEEKVGDVEEGKKLGGWRYKRATELVEKISKEKGKRRKRADSNKPLEGRSE